MLNVETKNFRVEVRFKHVLPSRWDEYVDSIKYWFKQEEIDPDKVHGMTLCTISYRGEMDGLKIDKYLIGFSACSKRDQFNRKVGRKVALQRTLQPLDKKIRTEVWKEYWND